MILKNKLHRILILILVLNPIFISGKKNIDVDKVTFEFWHSRRIPHNHVKIEITEDYDSIVSLKVVSEPYANSERWGHTKVDTTFNISRESFEKIASSVVKIIAIDFIKADESGFDGYYCKLAFETFGSELSYSFWSPSDEMEERGLQAFYETCKLVVKAADLKEEDIF